MPGRWTHPGCWYTWGNDTPGFRMYYLDGSAFNPPTPPPTGPHEPWKSLPCAFGIFGLVMIEDLPSKKHFIPCSVRWVVSHFALLKPPLPHLNPPSSSSRQRKLHQSAWIPACSTLPFYALPSLLPQKGTCSPSRKMVVNLCSWHKRFSILSGPNI